MIIDYFYTLTFLHSPIQVFWSSSNVYPSAHAHSKDPFLLIHMWLQPPSFTLHSSTSSHPLPSLASVYPPRHSHWKEPMTFLHEWLQPPLFESHSSMSEKVEETSYICSYKTLNATEIVVSPFAPLTKVVAPS